MPQDDPQPPHSSAPEIPHELHLALLADYLDPNTSLGAMTIKHKIALPQLLDWAASPEVTEIVERFAHESQRRAAYLAAIAAPEAVQAAINCLDAANQETVRRAAGMLLRQAKPQTDPSRQDRAQENAERHRAGTTDSPSPEHPSLDRKRKATSTNNAEPPEPRPEPANPPVHHQALQAQQHPHQPPTHAPPIPTPIAA